MSGTRGSLSLATLPTELIQQIFSHLSPFELYDISLTCKQLNLQAITDRLWEGFVQRSLSNKLPSPKPCASFRDLYTAHHAQWFLPRHRIWFADTPLHGNLVVARYDPRIGSIEAYSVAAERGAVQSGTLDWETQVVYHTFNPKIRLDLNSPVVSLSLQNAQVERRHGKAYQSEILMERAGASSSKPSSAFMFARPLPLHLLSGSPSVWPPCSLPSPNGIRSRNESASGFRSAGHRPSTYEERSEATFRVRKFLDYGHHFIPMQILNTLGGMGGLGRPAEVVTTFGTLPEESYTPTKEKPWQGIWCGDYSAHGCEFLLIMQTDGRKALPEKARRAIDSWPRGTAEPWVLNDEDSEAADSDDDLGYTDAALQFDTLTPDETNAGESASQTPDVAAVQEDEAPYRGRLEAIKLTGDPNIPRGEITFIADDLGAGGFLGYAREPVFDSSMATPEDDASFNLVHPALDQPWSSAAFAPSETSTSFVPADPRGARIFKSVGHVAGRGFTDDGYIPSRVILISADRIAQYWQPFGHISFYQRVELDKLMNY